jgi:DNA-binding NtrC family response regulator
LVLLDVDQLAPMSQALLNRALEAGSGACRVVATTERSFEELSVRDQSFTDLLFLLAASRIVLPPLRLRRDDLLQLFENVLSECCVRTGRRRPQLDKKAVLWIHDHPWRGNLVELREVIKRLLEAEVGPVIGQEDLIRCAEEWRAEQTESVAVRDGRSLDELERVALYEALKESAGNRRRAAAKLGVSLRTIYNMIERHGFKG